VDKVKERRNKLDITQKALATLADVEQSQVSDLELGKRIPDGAKARILAALKAIETSPEMAKGAKGEGAAGDKPGMGTLARSSGSVLEISVGAAFDAQKHLIRDANAVLAAFSSVPLPQLSSAELRSLCAQWLDSAAQLRADGVPATVQAIVALVETRRMRSERQ
jgi:transcriptional regulator with XRE-family HTH domain